MYYFASVYIVLINKKINEGAVTDSNLESLLKNLKGVLNACENSAQRAVGRFDLDQTKAETLLMFARLSCAIGSTVVEEGLNVS